MYNYTDYVTSLANGLVVASTDANFQQFLPRIIENGENRIYREIDLLNTVVRDTSASFATGTRAFALPATLGTFFVVNNVYAITPLGTTADFGTRNALMRVGRAYLDATYPSSAGSAVPVYFSMTTQTSLIVGPWPDQAYQAEVVGTIHPAPLSSTNVTTLLTQYLPDLFFAASMVAGAAYLQNFGSQADNPQMGLAWEATYQALKQSAAVEEARKKGEAEGWSTEQPSQIASPPRT